MEHHGFLKTIVLQLQGGWHPFGCHKSKRQPETWPAFPGGLISTPRLPHATQQYRLSSPPEQGTETQPITIKRSANGSGSDTTWPTGVKGAFTSPERWAPTRFPNFSKRSSPSKDTLGAFFETPYHLRQEAPPGCGDTIIGVHPLVYKKRTPGAPTTLHTLVRSHPNMKTAAPVLHAVWALSNNYQHSSFTPTNTRPLWGAYKQLTTLRRRLPIPGAHNFEDSGKANPAARVSTIPIRDTPRRGDTPHHNSRRTAHHPSIFLKRPPAVGSHLTPWA